MGELVRPYEEWLNPGVTQDRWAALSGCAAAPPGRLGDDPDAMVRQSIPPGFEIMAPGARPTPKRRSRGRRSPPQAAQAQHFDIGASLPDHLQPRTYNDLETNRRGIEQYLRNIEGMNADGVRRFMQNLQADVAVSAVQR